MNNLEDAFVLGKGTARAMQRWLQNNCVMSERSVTSFADLHADWLQWSDINDCCCSTARRLSIALGYLGLHRCVISAGNVRAYRGIALKSGAAK